MAQVERFAVQVQSLSEKTSDVFTLLPESRHNRRSCLALHVIPLPIDLPSGVGPVFNDEFDDVRDSHQVQVVPPSLSKKRLSNPYSPADFNSTYFGADSWAYDCGLMCSRFEELPGKLREIRNT